tara:strand:+ start:89 stop:343 length:255 start_codon:yes stop_codon:yes gene_type:complete
MIAKLKPTFQEPNADLRRRLRNLPPRLPANRGQIEVVSGQSQWRYCPEEIDDLLNKKDIDEETSVKLLQVADHMIMLFGGRKDG